MQYKEIKIFTSPEKLDSLVELLAFNDITDIAISDPRDSKYLDMDNEINPDVLSNLNKGSCVSMYRDVAYVIPEFMKKYDISTAIVDDQDWLHKWEEFFIPSKISEKIVVKPLWREYEPNSDETVIEIDPGMAFGTGTHPTTAMCARLVEKYVEPNDSVLDVGCGTGILSIVAAKFGASNVLAVDLDADAVEMTKRNAELNNCRNILDVREGDLTKGLNYKANIVVANLLADLVIMLSNDVAKHCKSEAYYITSGVLDEQENIVKQAVINAGFTILEVIHENGWCAIAAQYCK